MNPTLVSLAQTLRQVAPAMGQRIFPQGAFVAGVVALAMGAMSAGATAQEHDAGVAPPAPPSQQPMSESATRNVGRAVGGLLGYVASKAADAGSAMTAVLTVGGVLAGDYVAKSQAQARKDAPHGDLQGQQAQWDDRLDPAVLAALSVDGRGSRVKLGTQPLPADLAKGLTDLVIDAAAHRLLAQESWKAAHMAASAAAVRPHDAAAAQISAQAAQNFKEAMRRNNQSFYWFRNAVGTLHNGGYDVEKYLALNRVLSQNVDRNGMVQLGHPSIRAKVDELEGRQAAGRVEIVDQQVHSRVQAPEMRRADAQR